MPMSELELFGRVQDYGYAQADPLKVVESRHHFRIWKCPFTLNGQDVWAGAGMHDIGFDRDNRNNGVTHKIDPKTDGERDYIGLGLTDTGMVAKQEYMTSIHTVKEAKTATGSGFTSDGRTLVIYLEPSLRTNRYVFMRSMKYKPPRKKITSGAHAAMAAGNWFKSPNCSNTVPMVQ